VPLALRWRGRFPGAGGKRSIRLTHQRSREQLSCPVDIGCASRKVASFWSETSRRVFWTRFSFSATAAAGSGMVADVRQVLAPSDMCG